MKQKCSIRFQENQWTLARNLVDLEDILESEHIHNSVEGIQDANEDNLEQSVNPVEPPVLDLVIVSYILNARG